MLCFLLDSQNIQPPKQMAIAAKIQETFTEALGCRMIYALEKERKKSCMLRFSELKTNSGKWEQGSYGNSEL